MNIIITPVEKSNKIQEFKICSLGTITTDLQDLLDISEIRITSDLIPILSVIDLEGLTKQYVIKDLSENNDNVTEYITGQNLLITDLIEIGGGSSNVSQTITNGVTTTSPSEDIVYDALNSKVGIVAKDATASTPVTGTTVQTLIGTYFVPANTFSATDILNLVSFKCGKTGTVGTFTGRVSFATTNTFAGSTVIATMITTNTQLYIKTSRTFAIRGGTINGLAFTSGVTTDTQASVASIASTAFNPAINNWFFTSGQLTDNTTDAFYQSEFLITR